MQKRDPHIELCFELKNFWQAGVLILGTTWTPLTGKGEGSFGWVAENEQGCFTMRQRDQAHLVNGPERKLFVAKPPRLP